LPDMSITVGRPGLDGKLIAVSKFRLNASGLVVGPVERLSVPIIEQLYQ
jgi:hypothetical protein